MMIASFKSLHFLLGLFVSLKLLALAQEENHFIYHGFTGPDLLLSGIAKIHPNGLLELTNTSKQQIGRAFFPFPFQFNTSLFNNSRSLSFSTQFAFAMVPEEPTLGGHGMAFTISPSVDFTGAMATQYFGILNPTSNGLPSNHLVAVELDAVPSPDLKDINDNHVGIDVNSLISNKSAPVTLPLLSTPLDLSSVMLDSMYVGFSSSTGAVASSHYILGWSFNRGGQAQSLDVSKLPSLPLRHFIKHLVCNSCSSISSIVVLDCASLHLADEVDTQEEQFFAVTCFSTNDPADTWLIDSGCTHYLCNDAGMFKTLDESYKSRVKVGNGEFLKSVS